MSFSFAIGDLAADEARASVKATSEYQIPNCLKDFILLGIHGLKVRYGSDVRVSVLVRGHLCADGQSYEASDAEINIKKYVEARPKVDKLKPTD
jgi:hypothetical protein